MPFNYCGTKRPHEALLNLYIDKNMMIVERRREPQGGVPIQVYLSLESGSKDGFSDPRDLFGIGTGLLDKSYSGDNRLVASDSSH